MKRFILAVLTVLILQFVLPDVSTYAETDITVRYTALGDSLAVGINEQGQLGAGYPDFFAKQLQANNLPVWFNKGFSYPNYTTANVLADIQGNVTKPIYNLGGEQADQLSIKDGIAGADIISISVGANDILKHVGRSETGELTVEIAQIAQELENIVANYEAIFQEIKQRNSAADVIVTGYYNPFPYVTNLAGQLEFLVQSMDAAVSEVVKANGGVYVEIASVIATDLQTYLPNPQNIHLSETGYEAVAQKMYDVYVENIMADAMVDIEHELRYFTDTTGHWAEAYIQFVAGMGIMNGFADETFKPNQEMTRVQLISVLARTFEWQAQGETPFADVTAYVQATQDEVAAAFEAGIVKGYDGYLKPKQSVTRAQLALMLLRSFEHEMGESYVPQVTVPFRDIANYDAETQRAITFLYEYELAQGVSATTFAPASKLTRAQAAKILANTYE